MIPEWNYVKQAFAQAEWAGQGTAGVQAQVIDVVSQRSCVKPHEISTLKDLRSFYESLGIGADEVGWADDRNVRHEDGALLITETDEGSIELTPWSMSGPAPRTKTFPDMRSAMQDVVASRLGGALQPAVRARGVEWEQWSLGWYGPSRSRLPNEHVWSVVVSDGWMHVGGMTMGRFRRYSAHETVDEAADELARLVLTCGPSEPAPEHDLIAAGGATSQRILQRVDAEGGYARATGVGPGDLLDRVGHESGSQLFALGTPFAWRSQPPDMVGAEYHRYRVLAELPEAQEGRAAAWFDQPGGGAMVVAERPVRWYLDHGYLVEITDPA